MIEQTSLDYIKLALGIVTDEKDILITKLYSNVEKAICLYLGVSVLPQELTWISDEVTVVRYVRLGSEGIVQEAVDSLSTTYKADILSDYYLYLDKYKSKTTVAGNSSRLRML